MKKTLKYLMASFLITSLAFTSIFAATPAESDDYQDPAVQKIDDTSDDYEDTKIKSKTEKEKAKRKADAKDKVKEFFLGKEKYVFFDEVSLATGTATMGFKPRIASAIVNPETHTAGIQTYYQTAVFNIVFDEAERKMIADCVDKYLQDFDNHKLIKDKHLTTRRIYNKKGKCFVEWGTVKLMMNAYCHTTFTVGYEFKKYNDKNSPYFCIIIKAADNENDKMGEYTLKATTEIQLYFTKAQAKAFAQMMSSENIEAKIKEYTLINENDEYFQQEQDKLNSDDYSDTDSSERKYSIIDGSKKNSDAENETSQEEVPVESNDDSALPSSDSTEDSVES